MSIQEDLSTLIRWYQDHLKVTSVDNEDMSHRYQTADLHTWPPDYLPTTWEKAFALTYAKWLHIRQSLMPGHVMIAPILDEDSVQTCGLCLKYFRTNFLALQVHISRLVSEGNYDDENPPEFVTTGDLCDGCPVRIHTGGSLCMNTAFRPLLQYWTDNFGSRDESFRQVYGDYVEDVLAQIEEIYEAEKSRIVASS